MRTGSIIRLSLLIILLLISCMSYGQIETPEQRKKLFDELELPSTDTVKARIYLKCASYFLDKTPTFGVDLDSANKCIKKASSIMIPYGNKDQIRDIRYLQARRHIKNHDPVWGRKMLMEFINGYQIAGKKTDEGEVWFTFGIYLTRIDPFITRISSRGIFLQADYKPIFLECMNNAFSLGVEGKDKHLQAKVVAELASYYLISGDYDEAERQITKLLPLQKASMTFKPYEITYLQMQLEFWKNRDMVKATSLGLATLKNAVEEHAEADALCAYIFLARAYITAGDQATATITFRNYLSLCKTLNKPVDPSMLHYYLPILLNDPNKELALNLVKTFNPDNLIYRNGRKFTIAKSYAEVYTALKQYDQAEKYFALAKKTADNAALAEKSEFLMEFGELYYLWGKYDRARACFEETIDSKNLKINPVSLENAHLFLFKIDTLTGDYKAAVKQYAAILNLRDTLQNELMRKNIAELNIQYETAKKEKDIQLLNGKVRLQHLDSVNNAKSVQLLKTQVGLERAEAANKEKSIQLLNNRVKLEQYKTANKEKSIQVLSGKAKLQVSELQREKTEKNLIITGSVLLLAILMLILNQFLINRKKNSTIRDANESLQHLLKDKEVLMKEIHHRVKNNLQMVLSLLDTQSAYLADDALSAIKNSYNRVLAMSLIHQKLYISENTSNIEMSGYLWELVSYFQESFDTGGRIVFQVNIANITLDIAQAVPIGLIVNESVTNSIKYAFPEGQRGVITIEMAEYKNNEVILRIKDNGVGLPEQFDLYGSNSLGLRLIRGLSDNLEGRLKFEKNNGIGLTLSFYSSIPVQKSEFDV
jgi:two-component system, sensor histidine kinase PdtaS